MFDLPSIMRRLADRASNLVLDMVSSQSSGAKFSKFRDVLNLTNTFRRQITSPLFDWLYEQAQVHNQTLLRHFPDDIAGQARARIADESRRQIAIESTA